MDDQHAVIASLRNAVAALPEDLALRMHLASLLLGAGHRDEAVKHLGAILQADPGNGRALSLLVSVQSAASPSASTEPTPPAADTARPPADTARPPPDAPAPPITEARTSPADPTPASSEFNWAEAEAELRDVLPPMF